MTSSGDTVRKTLLFLFLLLPGARLIASNFCVLYFENGGSNYDSTHVPADDTGTYVFTVTGSFPDVNVPPAPQGLFQSCGFGDTNHLLGPVSLGTAVNAAGAGGWGWSSYFNITATSIPGSGMVLYSQDASHYFQVLSNGALRINTNTGATLDTAPGVVTVQTPGYVAFTGTSSQRNIYYFTGAGPVTTPVAHDTASFVFDTGQPNIARYAVSDNFDCHVCLFDQMVWSNIMPTSFPLVMSTNTFTSTPTPTPTFTITPTNTPVPTATPGSQARFKLGMFLRAGQKDVSVYPDLTVATFGHSYVWGYPYTDSYRAELKAFMLRHGRNMCFVGGTTRGTISCPLTDGINGAKVADIEAIMFAAIRAAFPVPTAYSVAVIGADEYNDANAGTSLAAFLASESNLINIINTWSPLINIVVCTGAQPPIAVDVAPYVVKVKAAYTTALAAGKNVYLVDWNSQTDTVWYGDGIHPAQEGFEQWARYMGTQMLLFRFLR